MTVVRFTPLPTREEQLRQLRSVKPHVDAPNPEDAQKSGPHILSSAAFNCIHAARHSQRLDDVADDEDSVRFAAEHINHHIEMLASDLLKLREWLRSTDSTAQGFSDEDDQLQLQDDEQLPPDAA